MMSPAVDDAYYIANRASPRRKTQPRALGRVALKDLGWYVQAKEKKTNQARRKMTNRTAGYG